MNRTIRLVATVLLTLAFTSATAQVKLTKDTIEAPIIGFSFGTLFPSAALSSDNGMHDLYKAPFLNFGVEALYKTKSNWLLSADGNFTMGADNLKDREPRKAEQKVNNPKTVTVTMADQGGFVMVK